MKRCFRHSQKGSLALVVLCLLAVLGIALAGYLAVSNQSMKLSNRSFQTQISAHLAEMGLEEAIRAFNTNNWATWTANSTTATWTTSGNTASCTITLPATKYGNSGVTGSVKIRVDNYNAYNLSSAWNSSTSYKISDVVSYTDGLWYACVQNNSNHAPGNLSYWAPAPIPWKWGSDLTYSLYDVANSAGIWYRYINTASSSGNATSSATYWATIPSSRTWVTGTAYSLYDVVLSGGVLYRCTTAHTSGTFATDLAANKWSSAVTAISMSWTASTVYTRGALLYNSGSWYYCTVSHTSSSNFSNDVYNTNPAVWECITSYGAGSSSYTSYSGSATYMLGDYVYQSGVWYRYKNATPASGNAVSNTTYWSSASASSGSNSPNTLPSVNYPFFSWSWIIPTSGSYLYNFNSLSYYSGSWYRCISQTPSFGATPTNTTYWENALSDSWNWSSGIAYNLNDVVYRSGSFYRCILAHTNQGPPNTTYWSPDPLQSKAWDAGKNYSQFDTVRYDGSWYLSLQNSNSGYNPGTNNSWWAIAPRALTAWDVTKNYTVDDLVSDSGTWYRCIKDTTSNQVTSNTTYWISLTGSSYAWSAATAYTTSSYVNYGAVWYHCILANTGQTPNNSTYWTALGAPVIYAEGSATLPDNSSPIKTQLRATVATAPLFPNAAGSTTTLTVSSAGTVDSYDSTVAAYSAPGGYSAVLAAGATSGTALQISGAATVQGYLAAPSASSSPYAPLTSLSTNAVLQSATSPASPKADLTRISRSPYIPQYSFNIQAQSNMTNLPTPSGTVNLGTPGAVTPSIYYYPGNMSLSSVTININGPVILYINGSFRVNTNSTIYINSTGSAAIYYNNRFRVESVSNGIQNRSPTANNPDPKKLILLSDNAISTTQYYADNSYAFYGVIYMPNVASALGLDIQGSTQVYGAISAKKITFSTNANLHYDTSLRYATFTGIDQPYIISQWRELTDPAERAVLP